MSHKIGYLKMNIEAGKASPAPPVGPALGLRGLNMMSFCKEFNDLTKNYKSGTIVPTRIDIFDDKSIKINLLTPSVTYILKNYFNISKGPSIHEFNLKITPKEIFEIAKIKKIDNPTLDYLSLCKSIYSTCLTLGIRLKN